MLINVRLTMNSLTANVTMGTFLNWVNIDDVTFEITSMKSMSRPSDMPFLRRWFYFKFMCIFLTYYLL